MLLSYDYEKSLLSCPQSLLSNMFRLFLVSDKGNALDGNWSSPSPYIYLRYDTSMAYIFEQGFFLLYKLVKGSSPQSVLPSPKQTQRKDLEALPQAFC